MTNIIVRLLLVLLLVNQWSVAAQTIDSLTNLLSAEKNTKKRVVLLNTLGNKYRHYNIDSAFKYISLAKDLSERNNLTDERAEAYNELGIIWEHKKNRDSTFFYLNKGYQLSKEHSNYRGMVKSLNSIGIYKAKEKKHEAAFDALNEALAYLELIDDQRLISMLYNNLALVYKRNEIVDRALVYYHKALAIAEEQNNLRGIGLVCSNMGLLYEGLDKTDLALEYLERSLKARIQTGNKLGESYVRTNLGLVYENLQDFDRSLQQYRESLVLKQMVKSTKGVAIVLNNMGIVFKKAGQYDSAFYYCNRALDLRIQLKDKIGEARTRSALGQIYYYQNQMGSAKRELHKALDLAADSKKFSVLQNIYTSLYNVSLAEHNFKKAVDYQIQYTAFKDSLFNMQKEKRVLGVESEYKLLKKEKENLVLARNNENKSTRIKRQRNIVIALLCFLILSLLLVISIYRSRKKLAEKNKEIEQQKQELSAALEQLNRLSEFKEAMTNMLVHDLKTPLNIFLNYKVLKDLEFFDDLLQQSGYSMHNLVNNILDVYKYREAEVVLNKANILLTTLYGMALREVEFLASRKKINLQLITEQEYLLNVDQEYLKRILVNLLTNAIKFTPSDQVVKIRVIAREDELEFQVENPGCGIPKEQHESIFDYFKQCEKRDIDQIKSSGLGLSFCKLAIEAHNGKIGVVSEADQNTVFWFTIPDFQVVEPAIQKSTMNALEE